MQENKKLHWDQKQNQQVIIFPICTIVHTYLDIMAVKDDHDISISDYKRNQP